MRSISSRRLKAVILKEFINVQRSTKCEEHYSSSSNFGAK